jgi:hypothetical protein
MYIGNIANTLKSQRQRSSTENVTIQKIFFPKIYHPNTRRRLNQRLGAAARSALVIPLKSKVTLAILLKSRVSHRYAIKLASLVDSAIHAPSAFASAATPLEQVGSARGRTRARNTSERKFASLGGIARA